MADHRLAEMDVRASWWTQSGRLSSGARKSIRNVAITTTADSFAGEGVAEQPADREADPGRSGRVQPDDAAPRRSA